MLSTVGGGTAVGHHNNTSNAMPAATGGTTTNSDVAATAAADGSHGDFSPREGGGHDDRDHDDLSRSHQQQQHFNASSVGRPQSQYPIERIGLTSAMGAGVSNNTATNNNNGGGGGRIGGPTHSERRRRSASPPAPPPLMGLKDIPNHHNGEGGGGGDEAGAAVFTPHFRQQSASVNGGSVLNKDISPARPFEHPHPSSPQHNQLYHNNNAALMSLCHRGISAADDSVVHEHSPHDQHQSPDANAGGNGA